jgi:acetyl-CoA acetyltransferase
VSEVWIRGSAMTRFSADAGRGARELVEEGVAAALRDAEVEPARVQAAYVGNACAGLMTGQECLRGQVVLRRTGLAGVPIFNVDNACASSATALHLGWQAVTGGLHDCVVVLGYETIDREDPLKSLRAIEATMDLHEVADTFGPAGDPGRDVYAGALDASLTGDARDRFDRDLLALVSVKNRYHGSLNACAHHRSEVTPEQVLDSPAVGGALTRMMCAQLSDGAACLVLCADGFRPARDGGVRIAASVLSSGRGDDMRRRFSVWMAARQAYEAAAVGPEDLDVVELYDGTALSELHLYRELGLCSEGDESRLLTERATWLGGRVPVNPSGGLIARGHPIGATGAAQVVELTWQLEGRCGARQVAGARLALAETTGGWLGSDVGACCVHVLQS